MQPSHEWFDELVNATRTSLTSYVRKFVTSNEDAQEIAQEAYLRVFCALRNERVSDHQPAALAFTAARNIAISRLRHHQVVARKAIAVGVAEELRVDTQSVEQQAGQQQKMQSLLLAVNQLPPKCRSVFVLRMIDGLSQNAIAEKLGISVSTVEKHLSRGLRKCRENLRCQATIVSGNVECADVAKRTGT